MAQTRTISRESDFQQIAGQVAIGAAGVALISGIIAIGAAALSDQRTRDKMVSDSKSILSNFRQVIQFLRKETENARKEIKHLTVNS